MWNGVSQGRQPAAADSEPRFPVDWPGRGCRRACQSLPGCLFLIESRLCSSGLLRMRSSRCIALVLCVLLCPFSSTSLWLFAAEISLAAPDLLLLCSLALCWFLSHRPQIA